LGNYSLCITPAAARATANDTTTKNGPTLMAILMVGAVRQYNHAPIAQWIRSRALLEATGCHHWVSIAIDSCNQQSLPWFFFEFFHQKFVKKGLGLSQRRLFSIGVLYIKQKRRA
jgi:hypothetical protein